jgi:hypothetical protein
VLKLHDIPNTLGNFVPLLWIWLVGKRPDRFAKPVECKDQKMANGILDLFGQMRKIPTNSRLRRDTPEPAQ